MFPLRKVNESWPLLRRKRYATAALAGAVTMSLALAACGSTATSESSPAAASAAAASPAAASAAAASDAPATSGADLATFEKSVEDLIALRSAPQLGGPPATGPTAAKDKKVYVIACLQALEGCQRPSVTAIAAGEAIGWDMKLIDTQSAPDKILAAVETAINDKVDGVLIQAMDVATLGAPLKRAKEAGIKIICWACVNQDDIADYVIPSSQSFYDDGYALAAQMYKDTGGHPQILLISNKEVGVIGNRQRGTEQFVADCVAAGGDCKIVDTQYFLFSELATRLPGLVTGELRQFPETNAIWIPFDSTVSFFEQGVVAAGIPKEKVSLYGFDGNIPNINSLRTDGYQKASLAGPFEWIGWAEIDAMNRLFQGEAPFEGVAQSKIITKDNLPPTDIYSGDVEYEPGYRKVWGV